VARLSYRQQGRFLLHHDRDSPPAGVVFLRIDPQPTGSRHQLRRIERKADAELRCWPCRRKSKAGEDHLPEWQDGYDGNDCPAVTACAEHPLLRSLRPLLCNTSRGDRWHWSARRYRCFAYAESLRRGKDDLLTGRGWSGQASFLNAGAGQGGRGDPQKHGRVSGRQMIDAEALTRIQQKSYERGATALRSSWPPESAMGAEQLVGFLTDHHYCVLATVTSKGLPQARPVAFHRLWLLLLVRDSCGCSSAQRRANAVGVSGCDRRRPRGPPSRRRRRPRHSPRQL
jgi:hypothetical protein